jgi:hypothetical protein
MAGPNGAKIGRILNNSLHVRTMPHANHPKVDCHLVAA